MNTSLRVLLGKLAPCVAFGILLPFFAHHAIAAPTSQEQARAAAGTWRASENRPLGAAIGSKILRIVTQNDENGKPLYHVVFLTADGASAKGFVIVAGDDEAEPIMAISSGSSFGAKPGDPLLALVKRQAAGVMHQLRTAGQRTAGVQAYAAAAKGKWTRLLAPTAVAQAASPDTVVSSGSVSSISDVRVAPLLQSTWSQSTSNDEVDGPACYNYYTPPYAAGNANNDFCGCVATAIGQVMRFWQYPATSVGTASFPIQISGTDTTADLRGGNGSGGAYLWDSMPLEPGNGVTTAEAEAIGDLIHDVALTAQTDFTADGSSGYLYYTITQMLSSFHYGNAVDVYSTGAISTSTLVSIITPDLDAGCPVCIAFTENGGHALVCDGYGYNSTTLYHHLNFGWDGDDDVWYALPTADTDNGDFSTIDECSFNIFPTKTGEVISGRVTDSNGYPISGAAVSAAISGGGTYTAATGANGIFALLPVPASSTFSVKATVGDHTFTSQSVSTGASVSGVLDPGYSNEGSAGSRSGINFQFPSIITDAVSLGSGWYSSATFGTYNASAPYSIPGWVYHIQLGTLYIDPSSTSSSIYFYDWSMQNWLWTSMSEFPFIYRFSSNPSWLYYIKGSNPPQFYNYGTGEYETN